MSYDFRNASSTFRWTGDLAYLQAEDLYDPYLNYVNTKLFQDRKKLAQLQKYVEKIQSIDFLKYWKKEEEYDEEEEEEGCLNCGLCVGEICKKCKPKNLCHYCGGYDGNFLRNEKFPCIAWCTPSCRYIPRWRIRPFTRINPILCIRTISYTEGINENGHF